MTKQTTQHPNGCPAPATFTILRAGQISPISTPVSRSYLIAEPKAGVVFSITGRFAERVVA